MSKELTDVVAELKARGAVDEARQLEQISARAVIPPRVVEALRLLSVVRAKAETDPKLVRMAARASLLSHEIQRYFKR